MKEYFELQYKMAARWFKDTGIEPALGYIIVLAAFIGGSFYLFSKTPFAPYIYIVIALGLVARLSGKERNDFIQLIFGDPKQRLVRVIENLNIAIPFAGFLVYKQQYLATGLLLLPAVLLAVTSFRTELRFTLPTPFYKKPFEFTVGFRNTLYLHAGAFLLVLVSVWVHNFNLGVFALLFAFALMLSYYSQPEPEYYVWIYHLNARQFLLEKIKTGLWFASLLVLPSFVILGIAFYDHIGFLLLFAVIGYLFLVYMIVSKYAVFPEEAGLLQGILIACCIAVPPLLVVFIPYFFFKSENRLSRLLK